jgi:hypothetical protein
VPPGAGYALKLNSGAAHVRQLTSVMLRWPAVSMSRVKTAYSPATQGLTSTAMAADSGCGRSIGNIVRLLSNRRIT